MVGGITIKFPSRGNSKVMNISSPDRTIVRTRRLVNLAHRAVAVDAGNDDLAAIESRAGNAPNSPGGKDGAGTRRHSPRNPPASKNEIGLEARIPNRKILVAVNTRHTPRTRRRSAKLPYCHYQRGSCLRTTRPNLRSEIPVLDRQSDGVDLVDVSNLRAHVKS